MTFLQHLSFTLDRAIEMLMNNEASKTEVALFLENYKNSLLNPRKEIVDGDFSEIERKQIEEKLMKKNNG